MNAGPSEVRGAAQALRAEAAPTQAERSGCQGWAHAAVRILNATACGIGASLAAHGSTQAHWARVGGERKGEPTVDVTTPVPDMRLIDAVRRVLQREGRPGSARVGVTAWAPPSRGLKTSSSVAAALLRAALGSGSSGRPGEALVARLAVAANRLAGTTLTGAADDQQAVQRPGLHVVDNRTGQPIARQAPPAWHVAVWVPEASIAKPAVAHIDATVLAEPGRRLAQRLVRDGVDAAPQVMTENGRLFHSLYAHAGLPVTDAPVQAALAAGALGAGLSGTGPAVAALFARRNPLADVAGGQWRWTEVVRAG